MIALLTVAIGVLVCLDRIGPRTPEINGKPITFYLEEWNRKFLQEPNPIKRAENDRAALRALEALRVLGPDAAAYLARRLERREPFWQPYYRRAWLNFPKAVQRHMTQPPPPITPSNRIDGKIVPVLIEALGDPDPSVQWAATVALSEIEPDAEITARILGFLNADTATVSQRKAAVHVLAKRRSPSYVPQFERALEDADPMVRRAAIVGLGAIEPQTEEVLAALSRGLNDPLPKNRSIAASALDHQTVNPLKDHPQKNESH